ncbi:chaperonin GroEL [Azospirillum lipoferum]|uniref:60 kDa chaperonin n=1 Tax=Azospirillum lipoferum TaxID=193 RepID=A0A5A9GRY3_AZOLI|nr:MULTISPECIES: molecular chaperone GroEL [Azospirillum]KAA0596394.1 molecular chaperone GroEL [Azospirillum lipoferum]MCP1610377.1 chaperonin GroEL [Azospirillum lipoferum]MDW5538179.1 molecular chaperone GroEL [Azospirillum sp. NL1]
MPKMMLHRAEARAALARGVGKLALAVRGTLGPKGTNAIIDRPIGTPMISRDGVSIAAEIELPCRFENMGAQVVREVSKQTNDVAGDGTTTATVLADALIQDGVAVLADGHGSVELVEGMERACGFVVDRLRQMARPLESHARLEQVATVAATDPTLGRLVADALRRVGMEGVIDIEYGQPGAPTALHVLEGMVLDRGFLSHHMATEPTGQTAVLERPYILMTDHKITDPAPILRLADRIAAGHRPLLIMADNVAPEVVAALMELRRDGRATVVAINPPEFGHWRQAMMEDIAILTGGRVIARDLGGRLDGVTAEDLGGADRIEVSAGRTTLLRGHGNPDALAARRALVQRQWEEAPPNIERDKLSQRLAKLTHGTALIEVGGATPVEQKRTAQLLEDSLAAARAALAEGVVPGGGTALARVAPLLDRLAADVGEGEHAGIKLVQRAMVQPLVCIAENGGLDGAGVAARIAELPDGSGFDARTGRFGDLFAAGIIDPVKVTTLALLNAVSVAKLVLTTHTLIADIPDDVDPTAGPARGGGMERYGRT